jgi:histidinol-phosphate/aromatic aminotransferase/cobyric acid decarboxylase-like protein
MYQVAADTNNVEVIKVSLTTDFELEPAKILQTANKKYKTDFPLLAKQSQRKQSG